MSECIAAIITPPGRSAISGLRVSGDGAVDLLAKVFLKPIQPMQSHRAYVGPFLHGDSGVAVVYINPHSYTGEDVVELFTHGSPASIEKLLTLCLENGARLAQPGEFTLRAFLNGKLDLTQAEAIPEIVEADSQSVFASAASQLNGFLRLKVESIVPELEIALASIEAWVDFSEEIGELEPQSLQIPIQRALQATQLLVETAAFAPKQRRGSKIAIVGPPNSGKSTLFNALVQADRAIVSDQPGTTRDTLHADFTLHGAKVELIDTAGIRESSDPIEQEGIKRALDEAANASLILFLTDLSAPTEALPLNLKSLGGQMPPILNLGSKCDLATESTFEGLQVSAQKGTGLPELRQRIKELLPDTATELPFLANERQTGLLDRAHKSILAAARAVENNLPLDLATTCLREAISCLNQLIGKQVTPDILESIFSKFCLGK